MSLEPKHKNFKTNIKLKSELKQIYQVPHVYISGF
jgi:hypothetical protein